MAVMNPYNYAKPKKIIKQPPVDFAENGKKSIVKETVPSSQIDQYLESRIMAAKPEELTYMLYEGLVKFIKKAMIHLENKNYQEVNYNSQRAQAIIDELRGTLNFEITMSQSLDDLYEYTSYKIMMANVEKKEALFKDALDIAEEFKETWKKAFNIK